MPKTGSHESSCSPLHKCAINRTLLPKVLPGRGEPIVAFHCCQGKIFGQRNLLLISREPAKPAFPLKIRVQVFVLMQIKAVYFFFMDWFDIVKRKIVKYEILASLAEHKSDG